MEYRRRHRERLLFLMFAGAASIMLLVIGGYQLVEFMDSTAFCGRLCHQVMYPEYTAYQASTHSRVLCTQCHVGQGGEYLVKSKISGVPQIFAVVMNSYPRPIPTPVANLRPARQTCENCHRPEKFTGDIVRVHTSYLSDEGNTKKVDTRVLRVGSGESVAARDIHWHISAKVWYLPLDEKRQEIGWIGVEKDGGKLIEYIDPKSLTTIDPQRIQKEKRLMDCIDCHNRPTHIFRSPADLIDEAINDGKVDSSLPFIKREGVKALDPANPSLEQAISKVEAIKEFYKTSYPDVYTRQGSAIDKTVESLKGIAKLTTFPDMKITWKTYIDNLGHQDSPGCLRCHGKLAATTGDQKDKKIDAACDSCHYFTVGQK